jgi:hypothetical protein
MFADFSSHILKTFGCTKDETLGMYRIQASPPLMFTIIHTDIRDTESPFAQVGKYKTGKHWLYLESLDTQSNIG